MENQFDRPEYFINRELSWLKFNQRVLNEAADNKKPLMERLRFIAIFCNNLDEFFMIRVAGLQQQLEGRVSRADAAGLVAGRQLEEIGKTAHALMKHKSRLLGGLLKEMEKQGIRFCTMEQLTGAEKEWVEGFFFHTIYPVLTPLGIDAHHPFPFFSNKSLHLAVHLSRPEEEDGEDEIIAVVPVPGSGVLPRIIHLQDGDGGGRYIFLEEIIAHYCSELFRGYTIEMVAPFRITRNADLLIAEEEAEDLLEEVEKSLRQRKRGDAVRLEIGRSAGATLKAFLQESLELDPVDIYESSDPLDDTCYFRFADLPAFQHLCYPPFHPQQPEDLKGQEDIYAAIREREILLHHPYESFEPVLDFVRQAAEDPTVLAIKQTLYRVSGNSPIVHALAQAAENGKQVTVLVELKARFDEEKNIQWARRLEEAGCHVIYGLMGLKTHAKILLVVRQESGGIKRYVHMSTGNYNDSTAKIYTDFSIFTANDQFGADASAFFNTLSGYSDPPEWNKLVVAPLGLRKKIYELLEREMECARAGKPAHLIAKMNSLIDKEIIMKLYEASTAGVKIDLIVRGICGLRPGIPGISERITVRSIVGRFLEHHRVFYFANGGDERVYLSSADWMPRNLNDRVELLFPVEEERHVARIKRMLKLMLKDNEKAYQMRVDGAYRRVDRRGKGVNSQEEIYRKAQAAAVPEEISLEQKFQPHYRRDE